MQALYSWDVTHQEEGSLGNFPWLDSSSDDQETLDFARLLLHGTLEELPSVDEAIKRHLSNWDISRLAKVDLAILRLSAYCILYQPEIPDSVTIDEAIDIAKDFSSDDAYRFVSGVLDGLRKELRQ
jgi:transcription antitermination protein NusB